MKIYNRLKEKDFVGILFIIFFVFQFIQIFRFGFFVQSDDFGYIANAAFFSGYNWNPYTGNMTQYFNIGFPVFASFAFKLFHNPASIYKCLLFVIVAGQTVLMYLVYKMLNKFFEMDRKAAAVIALLYSMGTMAPQNGVTFMTEVPVAFCFILALYLMLEAESTDGRKKKIMSALFGVVTAYSYTVHTRFLIMIVALFATCILYHLFYKKKAIHYLTFFVTLVISFAAAYFWVQYVQGTLYKTDVVGRVINGNDALARLGYIDTFLGVFTSVDSIKNLIVNGISLVVSYTLLTCGMIWITGVPVVVKTFEILKKKESSPKDRAFFLVSVGGIISFVGMNVLVAFNGAVDVYATKWKTYYRYGRPFVGIFLILALVLLCKRHMSKKQILACCLGVAASLGAVFRFTIPIYEGDPRPEVSPVGWFQYFFYSGQSPRRYFTAFAVITAVLFAVMILCIAKKKLNAALGIFLVFSITMTCSENSFHEAQADKNYQLVDKTEEFMDKYEDRIEVPVYFLQGSYSARLRYVLYDVDMDYMLHDEELSEIDYENAMILTDHRISKRDKNGNKWKYFIKLDAEEYVYTSNEELYEMIKDETRTKKAE